jgi:RNA polymerase sigma-70 factor (ECF subfamily)
MSRDLPSPFSLSLGATETDERASFDEETTTLFRTFSSRLLWFLRRRFGEGVARDATQEAFLRLHRARRDGTHIDNPKSWLARVARHVAIDQVRRSRFDVPLTGEVAQSVDKCGKPIDTPEQICSHQQRLTRIKHEVSRLTDVERTCLRLRAEGRTYQAIASEVGMDYRRVAELLHRVTKKLAAV